MCFEEQLPAAMRWWWCSVDECDEEDYEDLDRDTAEVARWLKTQLSESSFSIDHASHRLL